MSTADDSERETKPDHPEGNGTPSQVMRDYRRRLARLEVELYGQPGHPGGLKSNDATLKQEVRQVGETTRALVHDVGKIYQLQVFMVVLGILQMVILLYAAGVFLSFDKELAAVVTALKHAGIIK